MKFHIFHWNNKKVMIGTRYKPICDSISLHIYRRQNFRAVAVVSVPPMKTWFVNTSAFASEARTTTHCVTNPYVLNLSPWYIWKTIECFITYKKIYGRNCYNVWNLLLRTKNVLKSINWPIESTSLLGATCEPIQINWS